MVMVSGQNIAQNIQKLLQADIATSGSKPRAAFVVVAPTVVTRRYLAYKQAAADVVGVAVEVIELPTTVDTPAVVASIEQVALRSDAIVVQLPLPSHLDTDSILAAIPPTHDADALRPDAIESGRFRSPVVEAIAAIFSEHNVTTKQQMAVVVGHGRLVGQPVAAFLEQAGATVQVITEKTFDAEKLFQQADIIVLGAGVPGLLQPEMIKSGVVVIDAATSEQSGRLTGDADLACAELAAVFTPVPGGVGPITIAALLVNIQKAARESIGGRKD